MTTGCFRLPIIKKSSFSEQGDRDYCVRFFDYDGTLLKTQWVYDSEDASAPPTPTHENLTFYGWNKAFTQVIRDMDVGAIYYSADTYIYITTTSVNYSITVSISKSASTLTTVFWGDGTSSSSTTVGNVSFTKMFSSKGNYVIRINSVDPFTLGQNSSSIKLLAGLVNRNITKILIGEKATLSNYCLSGANALTVVSVGATISSVSAHTFNGCGAIKHINLPASCTSTGVSAFASCYSLESISLGDSVNLIEGYSFYYCRALRSIIIPSGVTIIKTNTFIGCSALDKVKIEGNITTLESYAFDASNIKDFMLPASLTGIQTNALTSNAAVSSFVFLATTPPSLHSSGMNFMSSLLLTCIYVPDASVTAYKTATNWSSYANYIYPLSSRP